MTPEALSSWEAPKRTTLDGQPRYSDLAMETAMMLGLVFGLRLRQTEGLLTSVLQLVRMDFAAPSHTMLSRRASKPWWQNKRQDVRGCVPEKEAVHVLVDSTELGVKSRRGRRKLQPELDVDSGDIIVHVMTDQTAGDALQMEPLLDQFDPTVHDRWRL